MSAEGRADDACSLCRRAYGTGEFGLVGVDLARERVHEALFTVANGYLATRGADASVSADREHYPGTYVAGIYNRLRTVVDGVRRSEESIVNLPNWLALRVGVDGEPLDQSGRVGHQHRLLDMNNGTFLRESDVEDPRGRRTILREERFASMRHPHLAYLQLQILPQNWSGTLSVESLIDGDVVNGNVRTSKRPGDRHLAIVDRGHAGERDWLVAQTSQSHVTIALATSVQLSGSETPSSPTFQGIGRRIHAVSVSAGREVVIVKVVAIVTSRDRAVTEPLESAHRELDSAQSFSAARSQQSDEWGHIWRWMHLVPEVAEDSSDSHPGQARRAVNLQLFHVAQTLSRHSADADVGVPARGLHGEAYRGHVFWDELFVFPLLNLRMPELTRALLLYRYRRLPEARRRAGEFGGHGALFPWQSGSDGREETPPSFLNPRTGRWMADHSARQFHVGLAIAYNVWQYFQVTGDSDFLRAYGAELIVEIARFWSSRAEGPDATGRYHLRGTMGPDEFHDGYPGAPGEGIDDNAYVAVMTSWLFVTALRIHRVLGGLETTELWQRLGVTKADLRRWDHLSRHLHVPFLANGLLAQFQGYEALRDIDLDAYRARYGRIGRLDLILDSEGDTTNAYKVAKQADVLMLFYLFSAEELAELLGRLDYRFDPADIPATIDYYRARTTHGSTLSRVVHAWVLSRGDRQRSWHLLGEALEADMRDDTDSTTGEGVHLGAMAATADILQRCYTGLQLRDDVIQLHPQLPDALRRLRCGLQYRGHDLTLDVDHESLEVSSRRGDAPEITIVVDGAPHPLRAGGVVRVARPTSRALPTV